MSISFEKKLIMLCEFLRNEQVIITTIDDQINIQQKDNAFIIAAITRINKAKISIQLYFLSCQ